MIISASQIKCFLNSKAKWAGKYVLGIKDEFNSEALVTGKALEEFLLNGTELNINNYDTFGLNVDKIIADFEAAKHNTIWIEIPKWEQQKEVHGMVNWVEYVGYIDSYSNGVIYEIKTANLLTQKDWKASIFSGIPTYEEYRLQCWLYMRALWADAKLVEIGKHVYKDGRVSNQIFEFKWSKEFDDEMLGLYWPVIDEMKEMFDKYSKF